MKTSKILTALLGGLLFSGATQAALLNRGGGLIYDTLLNVTWLQDANYAKTSGFDVDGLMNWNTATSWAANLSYYDSVRNVTYTDWRLPMVSPVNGSSFNYNFSFDGVTDIAYNISKPGTTYAGSTASEMAHLYYSSLGNPSYYTPSGAESGCYVSPTNTCLDHTGPFTNFQSPGYWSGPQFALSSSVAWVFGTSHGTQSANNENYEFYALAVRPGDVAAVSAVPLPLTAPLLLMGLGALGAVARRRRRFGV